MNKVLNAVKRLERVGSENSIWSKKLQRAIDVVIKEKIFTAIEANMPEVADEDDDSAPYIDWYDWTEMTLPRGYYYSVNPVGDRELRAPKTDAGNTRCLYPDENGQVDGGLLFSEVGEDFLEYLWGQPASQKELLQFSIDVATGLLDEIEEMLKRKKDTLLLDEKIERLKKRNTFKSSAA